MQTNLSLKKEILQNHLIKNTETQVLIYMSGCWI